MSLYLCLFYSLSALALCISFFLFLSSLYLFYLFFSVPSRDFNSYLSVSLFSISLQPLSACVSLPLFFLYFDELGGNFVTEYTSRRECNSTNYSAHVHHPNQKG